MFSKGHTDTILTKKKIIPLSLRISHVQGLRWVHTCFVMKVFSFFQKTSGHLQRTMTNLHLHSAKWTSVQGTFAQSLLFSILAYVLLSALKWCTGTLL